MPTIDQENKRVLTAVGNGGGLIMVQGDRVVVTAQAVRQNSYGIPMGTTLTAQLLTDPVLAAQRPTVLDELRSKVSNDLGRGAEVRTLPINTCTFLRRRSLTGTGTIQITHGVRPLSTLEQLAVQKAIGSVSKKTVSFV